MKQPTKQPTKRLLSKAEIILAENTDKLRGILERRSKEFLKKLHPLQEICSHLEIEKSGAEDFIVKYTGICPDCKKVILPNSIFRILESQYQA